MGLSARNEDIVIPRLELAPAHIITSRVEAENAVKRRDVTAESAAKILTDVDALAVMKVASEPVDCESAQAYIDVAERNKAVVRARSHVEMLIHGCDCSGLVLPRFASSVSDFVGELAWCEHSADLLFLTKRLSLSNDIFNFDKQARRLVKLNFEQRPRPIKT